MVNFGKIQHIFDWVIDLYLLCSLPYQYEALEPFIDTHTLGLHYQKHQKGYLKKLNELLEKNHYQYEYPMEFLSYHILDFPEKDREDILFNLGGVLNHNIYFQSMSNKKGMPSDLLMSKILQSFESFDQFKKLFKEQALKVKGSGYTYLVVDSDNKLLIINFLNQDCPYFHQLIPLLCIDLWEHAYYLNYENKRDLYIDNFFEVMDFSFVNQMYEMVVHKGSIFKDSF